MKSHALVATTVLCCLGCPEKAPDPEQICEPGETQACTCSSGQEGAQTCSTDGQRWENCVCDGEVDAGVVDGAALDAAGVDAAVTVDASRRDSAAADTLVADSSPTDSSMCTDPDGITVPCSEACGAADCALDILFVVDNSGSMSEEQLNLASHASSLLEQASRCDATGFANLVAYLNANPGLPFDSWSQNQKNTYADCGLLERLQIANNRYRIGVITTDMEDCDAPYGSGAQRGSVPQRGCLQAGGVQTSLRIVDWQSADPATDFADIVTNVNVYGSAYEKGLEAAVHFLTPGHSVPTAAACDLQHDCSGDLAQFWRDTALTAEGVSAPTRLLVIFVTDEDDCSHGGNINETVSGNTDRCYDSLELLTPVGQLAANLMALKAQAGLVSVGVIAGYYGTGAGIAPSGCKPAGNLITDDCDPAQGNSVATCTVCVDETPVCPCHPVLTCPGGTAHAATNCCQADPAYRYDDFSAHIPTRERSSVCQSSYRAALNDILAGALPDLP